LCRRVRFGADDQIFIGPEHDEPEHDEPEHDEPEHDEPKDAEREDAEDGDGVTVLSRLHIGVDHVQALIDGRPVSASLVRSGDGVSLLAGRRRLVTHLPDHRNRTSDDAGADAVLAPMSGTVQQVDVAAGDVVASGDRLLVLAAMKMEYALTAPRDGVIADVACAAGDAVGDAALLVRLEAVDD
jgi:3-methylcrotonyl-CoA carboxylase alpha subunit